MQTNEGRFRFMRAHCLLRVARLTNTQEGPLSTTRTQSEREIIAENGYSGGEKGREELKKRRRSTMKTGIMRVAVSCT